jgi:hypothetical protein
MTVELTLEEWGALSSCRDDGEPPTEGRFRRSVYDGLVTRGLMRHREGRVSGHGLCDLFLTTPAGEAALKDCKVIP